MFSKLAQRGNAVMQEWNSYDGVDNNVLSMLAEIAASTFVNLCGHEMKELSIETRKERVGALKIAVTSAFQIGRQTK